MSHKEPQRETQKIMQWSICLLMVIVSCTTMREATPKVLAALAHSLNYNYALISFHLDLVKIEM